MRKRSNFAVVHFPCFSTSNDDYYFSLLMLLLPHRHECDLVENYTCAKDAFMAKHSLLDCLLQMHNSFHLQVENSIRRIRLAEAALSDQNISTDIPSNLDIGLHTMPPRATIMSSASDSYYDEDSVHFHQTTACLMTSAEFRGNLRSLTGCQQHAMALVQRHYSRDSTNPLRLFITGGAGVGKSFFVNDDCCIFANRNFC